MDHPKEIQEMANAHCRDGISLEESRKGYTEWVKVYDELVLSVGYSSPIKICETLSKIIPVEMRENIHILDIGAGTGLVAKELKKEGFRHIDAFDPSESMLEEARNMNLYEKYIVGYFTDKECGLPPNSYDVITGSGIFMKEAHVSYESINEMIRLVKAGGYIILTARSRLVTENENYKGMKPLMRKLAAEGKWKEVVREIMPEYFQGVEGIIWCFQLL